MAISSVITQLRHATYSLYKMYLYFKMYFQLSYNYYNYLMPLLVPDRSSALSVDVFFRRLLLDLGMCRENAIFMTNLPISECIKYGILHKNALKVFSLWLTFNIDS